MTDDLQPLSIGLRCLNDHVLIISLVNVHEKLPIIFLFPIFREKRKLMILCTTMLLKSRRRVWGIQNILCTYNGSHLRCITDNDTIKTQRLREKWATDGRCEVPPLWKQPESENKGRERRESLFRLSEHRTHLCSSL